MRLRAAIFLTLGGLGTWGILHAQKPFLNYPSTEEHAIAPLPPDWERDAEWTRGRLKYHQFDLRAPSSVQHRPIRLAHRLPAGGSPYPAGPDETDPGGREIGGAGGGTGR